MDEFLNFTSTAYLWVVCIFSAHIVLLVGFGMTSVANLIHYQKVMQRELYSCSAYMRYMKENPRDFIPRHLGAVISVVISVVAIILTPDINLESELSAYKDQAIVWLIVGIACSLITGLTLIFTRCHNAVKLPFEWRFLRLYIWPVIIFVIGLLSYLGNLPKLYLKSALDSILPMGSAYYTNIIAFAFFHILVIFLPIISNAFMMPLEKLLKKIKDKRNNI